LVPLLVERDQQREQAFPAGNATRLAEIA